MFLHDDMKRNGNDLCNLSSRVQEEEKRVAAGRVQKCDKVQAAVTRLRFDWIASVRANLFTNGVLVGG